MRIPSFLTLSLLFTGLLLGCSGNNAQEEFEREAYSEPSGITQTNFSGEVVGTPDDNDWRISPFYLGLAEVEPVYPNPVPYGTNAQLDVFLKGIPYTTSLELGYFDTRLSNNPWVQLDVYDDAFEFSNPVLSFDAGLLFGPTVDAARGIYRLVLFDGNQRVITYGDLRIE